MEPSLTFQPQTSCLPWDYHNPLTVHELGSNLVLVRIFPDEIKHHDQKQLMEEMTYFSLQIIVHHKGKLGTQVRNPEAEIEAEAMEPAYLLAPHVLLSLFSYSACDPVTEVTHLQ